MDKTPTKVAWWGPCPLMCKPYQYIYMYWLSIPSTRVSKERILVSEVILDIKVMMCKSRLVKDIITKLWCNVGRRKYWSSAPFYFSYNVFTYFANRGISGNLWCSEKTEASHFNCARLGATVWVIILSLHGHYASISGIAASTLFFWIHFSFCSQVCWFWNNLILMYSNNDYLGHSILFSLSHLKIVCWKCSMLTTMLILKKNDASSHVWLIKCWCLVKNKL